MLASCSSACSASREPLPAALVGALSVLCPEWLRLQLRCALHRRPHKWHGCVISPTYAPRCLAHLPCRVYRACCCAQRTHTDRELLRTQRRFRPRHRARGICCCCALGFIVIHRDGPQEGRAQEGREEGCAQEGWRQEEGWAVRQLLDHGERWALPGDEGCTHIYICTAFDAPRTPFLPLTSPALSVVACRSS